MDFEGELDHTIRNANMASTIVDFDVCQGFQKLVEVVETVTTDKVNVVEMIPLLHVRNGSVCVLFDALDAFFGNVDPNDTDVLVDSIFEMIVRANRNREFVTTSSTKGTDKFGLVLFAADGRHG